MTRYLPLLLMILTVVTASASARAGEIQFLTHDVSGKTYLDEKGELRGLPNAGKRSFNVELVRAMMEKLGHPNNIRVVPFPRGMAMVVGLSNHALFNVSRSAGRESRFKWVGPLQTDRVYFYEHNARRTGIRHIDQARALKVCVLSGAVHDHLLVDLGFKNIVRNNSYSGCMKMLASGRIDLVPISEISIDELIREARIDKPNIRNTSVLLFESQGHIAFSPSVSNEEIKSWQQALNELRSSGEYQRLVDSYLLRKSTDN